jgi:hypothetical protein
VLPLGDQWNSLLPLILKAQQRVGNQQARLPCAILVNRSALMAVVLHLARSKPCTTLRLLSKDIQIEVNRVRSAVAVMYLSELALWI